MIRRGGSRRARGTRPYGNPFAHAMRSLGAIAHFDPSRGASDDGTTSTWVDRIGGNTVTSAAQASRLVYSSSLASLNGRPGWSGTSAANSHLLNTGSTALGLAMAGVLPHTIYTVRRCTLPTPAIYFSSSKSGSADYWYTGNINSVNNSNYVRFQASQANNSGIIRHTTEPVVAVHTFTGTTGAVHDNGGVGLAPAANTKNIDTNNLCIGALIVSTTASLALDGDIGDIIVFPTAHSDTTRRYVEQLIAAKYGWPCIQGLSGFTASNYLQNASTTSGIRGDNANGTWVDMLIRPDAVPSGTQYLHNTYVTLTGCTVSSSGASLTFTAGNSAIAAASPVQTIAATDVGKLMLFGGSAGPANLVRGFVNGAEVGAGTAMAGYTKNESMAFDVGVRSGASPASSYSLFGLAGGNVEQVAATQAARAAAIKAAGAFVATGGVAPTHAWALTSDAASFADLVGSDALTRTGTLARAQIIVTTWPW